MAIVGQVLPTPESGWQRIEEDNALLRYDSVWSISNHVIGNGKTRNIAGINKYVAFNFSGSKFRYLGSTSSLGSTSVKIYIDGIEKANFSQYSTTSDTCVLQYEVNNLADTEHTVKIINNTSGYIFITSIDIDSSGQLFPYNPLPGRCKTNISAATLPGDYVYCKYTATSGVVGTFSDLATKTDVDVASSLIPVTSTATPNGYFKFILVGYDRKSRAKFVADRNIQHSIPWDVLNSAGIASGSGVSVKIDSKDLYSVRLLSGGTSATDKDNEWDKIIAESGLNGAVTAGDNSVWNWNGVYSWLSTTPAGSSYNTTKTGRGYTSAVHGLYGSGAGPTSGAYTNTAFRPVLLVANAPIGVIFTEINPTHVYTNNGVVCIKANIDYESGDISWRLSINGVEKVPFGAAQNIRNITTEISISDLIDGVNAIKIEVRSSMNDIGETTTHVFKEIPYRTLVERTFTAIDGGYILNNITLDGTAKASN